MKTKLYYLLGVAAMFILLTSEINFSGGSPGGKTGSPGDEGNTCTDCHAGTATFQSDWISSTIPVDGYSPGETYTITASGTHMGVDKFGFEATAEDMSDNKTGTLIATNSEETMLANSNTSITHQSAGTTPSGNSKSWSFDWIAPAEGTGEVTFYSAFNATNGNGNTSGDVVYTSSHTVQENVTSSVASIFEEELVNVYPNPFNEQITIQADQDQSQISGVLLYNAAGQLMQKQLTGNSQDNINIKTNELTKGIYHLVVELNNSSSISKTVVKQ